MYTPITPDQTLPFSKQTIVKARLNARTSAIPSQASRLLREEAVTPSGVSPSRARPHMATAMKTTSTDSRPCSLQYTSFRCRTRANSSRTSAMPIPRRAAVPAAHHDRGFWTARPPTAPRHIRTSPNTTWWTCTPPGVTLPGHHFTWARIMRTLNRMNRNAAMKATKKQNSRSLPVARIEC